VNDLVGPPVFNLEPRRQSWGVYSVRAHMDLRALARELRLYDRLVQPVPEDIDEADRWDDQGWDTRQLDYVAKHMGDLVHLVPWTKEMRSSWQDHMGLLAAAGVTAEGAAYGATPRTMVSFIWPDVSTQRPPDGLPPVPPRIVAAYLSEERAAGCSRTSPEATRAHAGGTKRQWGSRLVAGGGGALANSQLPGAGRPVSFAVRRTFTRFPSYVPGPNPAGWR
jgi:hypothetical protein